MAKVTAADRRRQIGDAALQAFSQSGFRLTQVADIAKLAGTAPGTLYLYAPSKEALFLMAIQRSLGEDPHEAPLDPSELLDWIPKKLLNVKAFPRLVAIVENPVGDFPTPEVIFGEIWEFIERLAPTINLIERCAQDWPELAGMFYDNMRPKLLRMLATYLELASDRGFARRPPDFHLAARLVVETTAWFTMHRQNDRDGRFYDAAAVRLATLDALVHAYAADSREVTDR
jgi:AcrR family transcriptional regulator